MQVEGTFLRNWFLCYILPAFFSLFLRPIKPPTTLPVEVCLLLFNVLPFSTEDLKGPLGYLNGENNLATSKLLSL